MKMAVFAGKCVLFLASMALITGISLFVVGSYLTTWPLLRLSPRSARTKAAMQIATGVMSLVATLKPDEDADEVAPNSA